MKIERVDESTVKCYLSMEELQEYEIDYKDFITRSEKAREVVHEIIAQATEEVGFKPPKFAFDMQIMMMPEQGVVLTLSEKDPIDLSDRNQVVSYLNELRKFFQHAKEKFGVEDSDLQDHQDAIETVNSSEKANVAEPKADTGKTKEFTGTEFVIFRFGTMRDVLAYAAVIPSNMRVKSTLYEMNGEYYLTISKGNAAYARFSRACAQAMEFGKLYAVDEGRELYLKEHGQCVVEEGALRKLRL